MRPSKWDIRNENFRDMVNKKKRLYKLQFSDLAKSLGCCEQTVRNKVNQPCKFTVEELDKLFAVLRFTSEEKLTAFIS